MDATGRTTDGRKHAATLEHAVKFASWPTPQVHDQHGARTDEQLAERRERAKAKGINPPGEANLHEKVLLLSWPTPQASDDKGTSGGRGPETNPGLRICAGWTTPMARDDRGEARNPKQRGKVALELSKQAQLAGWATPTASEKMRSEDFQDGRTLTAREALGLTSSGSPAETGKPGQLNPAFSLWLMGYATAWARCAALVTRSFRKSRRSSSEP